MRIGILTLPFNNNYGGYLQCYALMTILKQMGHDVELIYRRQDKRPLKLRTKILIKNIIKIIRHREVPSIIPNYEKELCSKGQNMMPFVDKNIVPKTLPLYSTKDFNVFVTNRYDVIVVGSDQLWRPDYVPNIHDFFLADIKDRHVKRVAYAASFGSDNPYFTEKQKHDCGVAISKFSSISVREKSGIDIIKRFGWKCVMPQVVLDPTLLLSREHYNSLLPQIKSKSCGKICCYILDWSEDISHKISTISNRVGLSIFHILDPKRKKYPSYKIPSIEDWLSAIRDSEMVITDSYHGTVFSIIFQKPFVFLGNKERGNTRIESLFNLLEIDINKTKNLDYDKVVNRIEILRTKSISFLQNSI